MRVWLLSLFVLLVGALAAPLAHAQSAPTAKFRLQGGPPHAEVPFQLDLVVEGFDESPAPALPPLTIPGATVQPGDASPNVMTSVQIINGTRTDTKRVSWVLHYMVTVTAAGTVRVPTVTVTQGSRTATAQPGELTVEEVAVSDDMKVTLELPQRPIFVGETVPVKLVWLFRHQPQDQSFVIPLASSNQFTISVPPSADPRRAIKITAGAQELGVPYDLDTTTINGTEFNRLTLTFYAAPKAAGKIAVTPAAVVADLQVGRADFFGNAPTQMFRASDIPRTLEVKPLPETGKPASFAGAVGEQFSIAVRTSRSVVQLGEPVELVVEVKSDQRLDTLSLGDLSGPGGLPKSTFTVPPEPPTGVMSDDGKTKTFTVTAQVIGPAIEVPALELAYFDPAKAGYQTIHSEPIALSVKGGTMVGAADVVANKPAHAASGSGGGGAFTGGDAVPVADALALSAPNDVDTRPLGGAGLWILVAGLYLVPLALFGVRSWHLRTAGQREDAAEVKAARKKLEGLLDRAATEPAREIGGPLAAALRELARIASAPTDDDGGLLAKLETEAFAPSASAKPLSAELRSDAAGLLRKWLAAARTASRAAGAGGKAGIRAAGTLILVVLGASTFAHADALSEGRTAYREAMDVLENPTARKAAFARAEVALGDAVRTMPGRPQLLADWGNAALGAGDVATATLAYRRALAIDANTPRAMANLAWLRDRQPDQFKPPADAGATDTLLFFHHWPRGRRIVVGAFAFALAILLLVPWKGSRRRSLVGVAVLPAAIWLAMVASLLAEDRHLDDAVVVNGVVMRAADSAGAPPSLNQALPLGAEVVVVERRDSWTRIRVANGTSGWVPASAVERVVTK